MKTKRRALAHRLTFITLLAVFGSLFILGRMAQIWLPFWIVGTLGAAAYAAVLAIPHCAIPPATGKSMVSVIKINGRVARMPS